MRKRVVTGALGAAAFAAGVFGFGGVGSSSQALACPEAAAAACDPVTAVLLTACYSELPSVPTLGPITVQIDRRLPVYCPEFVVSR